MTAYWHILSQILESTYIWLPSYWYIDIPIVKQTNGALHKGPHQNQAISQKLGILGGKVTSMTGLRIQKYLLGPI